MSSQRKLTVRLLDAYLSRNDLQFDRLLTDVQEMADALSVAKAELEQHVEVPGVADHVLPCVRRALAKAEGVSNG